MSIMQWKACPKCAQTRMSLTAAAPSLRDRAFLDPVSGHCDVEKFAAGNDYAGDQKQGRKWPAFEIAVCRRTVSNFAMGTSPQSLHTVNFTLMRRWLEIKRQQTA